MTMKPDLTEIADTLRSASRNADLLEAAAAKLADLTPDVLNDDNEAVYVVWATIAAPLSTGAQFTAKVCTAFDLVRPSDIRANVAVEQFDGEMSQAADIVAVSDALNVAGSILGRVQEAIGLG